MSLKRSVTLLLFPSIVIIISATTIVQDRAVFALTEATLILDGITNVLESGAITVSGRLLNSTSEQGIANATISFSGTGASILANATTDMNGDFVVVGSAPNSLQEGWTVQAHFVGNETYASADSNEETFDTILQFPIQLGASVINITDLAAAIEFDDVVVEGNFTVTNCDTPTSERYVSVNKCLKMSSTSSMAPDTFAHIEVSFGNLSIPSGYSENNMAFFVIEPEVLDVTESRDLIQSTVTGRVDAINRFALGIALHGDKPANAIRQEIFVGDENEVSIRDKSNNNSVSAVVSLSQTSYKISDNATITVEDPEANLDPTMINSVIVGVVSTTDPEGIIIEIDETGEDTGNFEGLVQLVQEPSSGSTLSTSVGDNVTAYYAGSYGRLGALIQDVSEAGVVELSDFEIDEGEIFSIITPVGGAVDLEFINAQLGPSGKITVTMSYANADLGSAGLPDLRLVERITIDEFTVDYLDITIPDGLNDTAMTITGETNTPGQFFIASCAPPVFDCGPGGGGGGPFIPKGGVVLDSLRAVVEEEGAAGGGDDDQPVDEEPRRRSSGGGGGGPVSVQQVISGNNIETSTKVGSDIVTVIFESIESDSGQVRISEASFVKFAGIFDAITTQQGIDKGLVALDGSTFSTAGKIFDIDASAVRFDGMVTVTIPYDESIGVLGLESNIRFLHYDEENEKWEDSTVDFNIEENTVTGMMVSLSPVVAAVVSDETLPQRYFEIHPLSRIKTADKPFAALNVHKGETVSIPIDIKNTQRIDQQYTLLIQIVDEDGVARHLSWQSGMLARGQAINVSNSWMSEIEGSYAVQMFVWDGIDSPSPLSDVRVIKLRIQ